MKRFSKKLIYSFLFYNIFISLGVAYVTFCNMMTDEDSKVTPFVIRVCIITFVCVYIVTSLYSILYYLKSGYEIREKEIVCKRGVLFRKESILEFDKMHAINKKQNLFQQLFHIATLTIDSGSTNTSSSAEIYIIEDSKVVDSMIASLKSIQKHESISPEEKAEEKKSFFEYKTKTKWIYSLITGFWSFICIFIICLALFIIFKVGIITIQEEGFTLNTILIILLCSLLGFVVFSMLFSLIVSFVGYYNFKVYKNDDELLINYGLFVKNENVIKLNRIKGVRIKQNFFKRIFGYCSIYLEVIGYNSNGENGQKASFGVLVPICKANEVNGLLGSLLPNYLPIEKQECSKNFFPFVSYQLLFSSLIFVIVASTFGIMMLYINQMFIGVIVSSCLYVLYLLLMFINNIFAYHNSGIATSENKIVLFHGGLFYEKTVILKENIIGIDRITTKYRKNKMINSYRIHFMTNSMTNTVVVRNITGEIFEELMKMVNF